MANPIKSFKLKSGEEIVAEVTNGEMLVEVVPGIVPNPPGYVLRKPHVISVGPTKSGRMGLVMVPWMLSNQDLVTLDLPREALLVEPFDPSEDTVNEFRKITSPIQMVAPGTRISSSK
jgi:hypothetical protein